MNWVECIVNSLKYIEENIKDIDMGPEKIAQSFYISTSHYQRAFTILTGMTVSEYIRNRRLSIAVQYLLEGDKTVLEVSLDLGYYSPETFCKAFKRFHGISPREVKKGDIPLKAFPPLQLKVTLEGEVPLHYKIVEKHGFTLIGKSIEVSIERENYENEIMLFWDQLDKDGTIDSLCSLPNLIELTGACFIPNKIGNITYAIAAIIDKPNESLSFQQWQVEQQTWVIFECLGALPNAIEELWIRIYLEWLPTSGFEQADGPQLEVYLDGDHNDPNYQCEIWIPVVKNRFTV